MNLSTQVVKLHRALDAAGIPHAFGGALALGWCTEQARGTNDIDLNVFVGREDAARVIAALPNAVVCTSDELAALERDGQVRVRWAGTPIDLFLDTTPFHDEIALRTHVEPFAGAEVPFLGCSDLAVFKAFFNRTRDWGDIEEMLLARTLDRDRVLGILVEYLGPDDERVERLRNLASP